MPRQIAQVADGQRGDEARANETMREEIRDPLAVLDIRLPARHRFDVVRIGQHDVEAALE